MKIVAAAVEPLQLRLRRPLVSSQGSLTVRAGFLLRLTGSSGGVGTGEASPAYWIGEGSLARTAEDLHEVVALVRGQPSAAAVRARLLADAAERTLSAAAACALDSALLDLAARSGGVALCTRLWGDPERAVAVAALVGGGTLELLVAEVETAVGRGFATLKLKVGGGELAEDVRRVAAVRAGGGARIRLRLDANRAWTLEESRRALAALAPFDVEYLEEPLRHAEPGTLAELARETSVPLAVDESIVDRADLERLLAAGVRVHVVLKAARVGGPTRMLALARAAAAAGLPVVVTDSIESTIGMSVAVHVAASLPAPRFAVGLGGAQLSWAGDGVASHPLCVPWLVPVGPGLTVAVGAEAGEVAARG